MAAVLETITKPIGRGSNQAKVVSIQSFPAPQTPGKAKGSFTIDMTNAEYHADRSAVSCTKLKKILISPAHFITAVDEEPEEADASQRLGTALHLSVLEPQIFRQEVVIWERRRQSTEWDMFKEANKGKLILNRKEVDLVAGMTAAVLNFPELDLKRLFAEGEPEKTIFWVDEETGILCKVRLDLQFRLRAILDLKTVGDARPGPFLRSQALKLDYDFQAAMYSEGAEAFTGKQIPFNFVAVETEKPHGVWVHEAPRDGEFYQNGARKFRHALRLLKYCQEMNEWPCYGNAYTKLTEIPSHLRFESDIPAESE